jgi:hypothetical protein
VQQQPRRKRMQRMQQRSATMQSVVVPEHAASRMLAVTDAVPEQQHACSFPGCWLHPCLQFRNRLHPCLQFSGMHSPEQHACSSGTACIHRNSDAACNNNSARVQECNKAERERMNKLKSKESYKKGFTIKKINVGQNKKKVQRCSGTTMQSKEEMRDCIPRAECNREAEQINKDKKATKEKEVSHLTTNIEMFQVEE